LSQELERVYTINLGKVLLSPNNQRSKRAINMIKEFARHHMKTEDVRIDEDLAHQVWNRGIKHPPRKVRVRMTKTEEGHVLIAPYEEELETKVTPEEKPSKLEEKPKEGKPKAETKEIAAKVEAEVEKEVIEEPKKAPAKEEKPKLAGFVDPEKGPQHYIDRYNKEKKYKDWFHKNYPQYSTIYEAVGLEEPKEKPKKAPAKEEKPKKAPAKEEKPKKAPAKEEKPKKKSS
jgi:large subunit ribosomal protein L31e